MKSKKTGTPMTVKRIPQCDHKWGLWERAGIFDRTEVRRCVKCGWRQDAWKSQARTSFKKPKKIKLLVRCGWVYEREIRNLVSQFPENDKPDLNELLALTPEVAKFAISELIKQLKVSQGR